MSGAGDVLLRASGVTVRFGGLVAINALDLDVREGEVFALVGPNGAGKTTLLNVLSGFVKPIGGTITIDGTALLALSPVERVGFGLRRSFQQELVVGDLTAAENIHAIADHVSKPGAAAAEVADRRFRATRCSTASAGASTRGTRRKSKRS